jgi:hypothetical protein
VFSAIMLMFAFVLFVLSGFVAPTEPWRGRLLCLGLACWVLSDLLARVGSLPPLR